MPWSLERVQRTFAAALLDREDIAPLLPQLDAHGGRVADRLALYRGNGIATRERALGAAYPVVRALVGEEFFGMLTRAYSRAHPGYSGDLNRFGERLPHFLSEFAPAAQLPYLGDVAALDWLVHCAHYAADAAPVARAILAEAPAAHLLGARFELHPACGWVSSRFPVASIWLAHQPGGGHPLPESLARGEHALVVRPGWQATVVPSNPGEVAALARLRAGSDMECAIGAALFVDAGFDFARALMRWLDHAVVVGMHAAPLGAVCGDADTPHDGSQRDAFPERTPRA